MGGRRTQEIPAALLAKLREAGVRIEESRAIDHATQHKLSLGADRVTLNVYSTGKISEGGKESALKAMIRGHRLSSPASKGKPKSTSRNPQRATKPTGFTIPNPTPRVGTDEAGKGEYLGPLVVAGVRVRGQEEDEALREIGVRDSKDLGLAEARKMSAEIRSALRDEDIEVIALHPREYDARWRAAGNNVNRLLGELNVEVISKLQADVEVAVVDAFGVKAQEYVEAGGIAGVRIEARPRAEDDAAVAAASIMARARYLEEMDVLSERAGFTLPRGSTHVMGAAFRVYEEFGEEGLRDMAKVHFSITEKVVGR